MSEELDFKLSQIEREWDDLQRDATFTDEHDELGELSADIASLRADLDKIRRDGYKYKSFLENKVEVLADKWKTAEPSMKAAVRKAQKESEPVIQELVDDFARLKGRPAESKAAAFEAQMKSARTRISAWQSEINAISMPILETYYQTERQVRGVRWALEQVNDASFKLEPQESLIQAVKAEWQQKGKKKDDPNGILYLTDRRLIFEQKEKVATKKVLFIATEKESVQGLLLELPITAIEDVTASKEGMFSKDDHLEFVFGHGADFAGAHFHIDGQDCKEWAAVVKRVTSGAIELERVGVDSAQLEQEAEEALSEVPAACGACGAPLPELPAMQRQHTCEYCNNTMRW